MLMNSNKLMLSINKRLQDSGIIDDITDFFHEHSEYFSKGFDNKSIVNLCSIDIAMNCMPDERQNAGVFVLIDIGSNDTVKVHLSDFTHIMNSKVKLERTINNEEVSKYVYD